MNYHQNFPIRAFLIISFFLLHHTTNAAVQSEVKSSLINFLAYLNGTNGQRPDPSFGWNLTTDPCQDQWTGIICDDNNSTVARIMLRGLGLSGVFNASSLCNVQNLVDSLNIISLDENNISGQLPSEIANCKNLRFLRISHNNFSGKIPDSILMLNNLIGLDISYNQFSGSMPDVSRISELMGFLAEFNNLSGELPNFDFSRMVRFNVSYNNFSGSIPYDYGRFDESCFMNNSGLCGPPLSVPCSTKDATVAINSTSNQGDGNKSNAVSNDHVMFVLANVAAFTFSCLLLFSFH